MKFCLKCQNDTPTNTTILARRLLTRFNNNILVHHLMSGFETAPFPGENEETFHLQRSETGDARLSREKESFRINQQTNYNTVVPPKQPAYHKERDIFRGSSSSNFFNNKNGGKENDEDYDDHVPNRNNDVPKRKIIKKINRKIEAEPTQAPQTARTNRPTGFSNNFAGSSFVPSTTGRTVSTTSAISQDQYTTAIQNYRGRQRGRAQNREYNNADSFRNNERNQQPSSTPVYNEYNRNQYSQSPSTPAPFRTQDRQYKQVSRQSYQEQSTTAAPKQNYHQYDTPRIRQQTQQTTVANKQNYQYKQTENYPSTTAPFRQDYNKQTSQYKKETENYPTGAPFTKQTNYNQYDVPKTQQTQKTENYPTTTSYNTKQTYNTKLNAQFDVQKPTTYKHSENYPTTFSPKNKQTQYYNKQTDNYPTTPDNKQDYNRQTTYNQPFDYTKYDNRYNQPSTYSTTARPTTVHTQYTPTVPKQSTQYHSTTQATRFSKTFDESYDDGSYNPKYDDEKYKPEDEFLKTAHSQNFASSRNELSSSSKINIPIPTKEAPRPFSASTVPPKPSSRQPPPPKATEKSQPKEQKPEKKEKDVSYDYAYYDTNVGSEPDYDVGTEFARSTKKSN